MLNPFGARRRLADPLTEVLRNGARALLAQAVEAPQHKIRVFQRRAYGLKDEEYLRLKVLFCMLPPP